MKVSELINHLQKVDQEREIAILYARDLLMLDVEEIREGVEEPFVFIDVKNFRGRTK